MKMQRTVVEYGDFLCRRCFDSRYNVHLSHRDVKEIEGTCPSCKKLGGRIKMLGKW